MTATQLPLTGLQLRDQGIESLERHGWVHDARLAAEAILCEADLTSPWPSVSITSDNLHDVMEPPPHDNCYGAIFKDKRFVATGERVRSTRPEAHGRWVMVWRLR